MRVTRYLQGGSDYLAIAEAAKDRLGKPTEISEAHYTEMLNILPPIYVEGGFLVMEAITSCSEGNVHTMYARRKDHRGNDRYFAKYVVAKVPETYIQPRRAMPHDYYTMSDAEIYRELTS